MSAQVFPRRKQFWTSFPLTSLLWGTALAVGLSYFWATRANAIGSPQEFQFPTEQAAWPLIVPMLAAATSIERVLEMSWNFIEWGLTGAGGWTAADLKKPAYQQFKSGVSLLIANALGVSIASYTDVRILSYLQPGAFGLFDQVPVSWDIILTGLLIGSATKPTHDILGLVTRLKSLVGNLSNRQREQSGLFAANASARLQEQQHLSQARTLAAHQPTIRSAQAGGDQQTGTDQAVSRESLMIDIDSRYSG